MCDPTGTIRPIKEVLRQPFTILFLQLIVIDTVITIDQPIQKET